MATSRTHLTRLPRGFIVLRIFQLIVAILTMGLSIFVLSQSNNFPSLLTISVDAVTLVILVWVISATYCAPRAYNYWAVLAMEIFTTLLWAIDFGMSASISFLSDYYNDSCGYEYNYSTDTSDWDCSSLSDIEIDAQNSNYVVTALSGCMFLFFLTSLIIVSVFIARHRRAGGHNVFGSTAPRYPMNLHTGITPYYPSLPKIFNEDHDLRERNIALQQQYLDLQRQHLALKQQFGMISPPSIIEQTTATHQAPKS